MNVALVSALNDMEAPMREIIQTRDETADNVTPSRGEVVANKLREHGEDVALKLEAAGNAAREEGERIYKMYYAEADRVRNMAIDASEKALDHLERLDGIRNLSLG